MTTKNLLVEIVNQYPKVWENTKLIKALSLDFFPEEKLMRNLIMACVDERIPHEISRYQSCDKTELFKYANRIVMAYGCGLDKAKEIVYMWAEALDIENRPARRTLYPGYEKCETLREIRKKIAEANGIPFTPAECEHNGPCAGTCPACDAEIQYLDRELQKIKSSGGKITLAGIAEGDISKASISILNDDREIICGSMPPPPPVDGRSKDPIVDFSKLPDPVDDYSMGAW